MMTEIFFRMVCLICSVISAIMFFALKDAVGTVRYRQCCKKTQKDQQALLLAMSKTDKDMFTELIQKYSTTEEDPVFFEMGGGICAFDDGFEEILILGKDVESIDDSAFAFSSFLKKVILSENLKRIGSEAFTDCDNLTELEIPESVTEIGNNAFSNCAKGFKIIGKSGSYAEQYAAENGIEFVAKQAVSQLPHLSL